MFVCTCFHCQALPSENMVSSKGKPTDPKLREEVKESKSKFACSSSRRLTHPFDCVGAIAEVKNETNKDGGGKGQMAAWKGSKLGSSIRLPGWQVSKHVFSLQRKSRRSTRSRVGSTRMNQAPRTSQRREHLSPRVRMVCSRSSLHL